MTRLPNKDTFCIGDIHGHLDRLEALLEKAGTKERDCTVILLGDLGHFGHGGSPSGDLLTWEFFKNGGVDFALWGNHDRAVVDRAHMFGGYQILPEDYQAVKHMMRLTEAEGRLLLAAEVHGWLLTHAGLHAAFKYNKASIDKDDPGAIAEWINLYKDKIGEDRRPEGEWADLFATVNAVGNRRGGYSPHGGILWRDITEKLYRVPQIFGHSASKKHEVRGEEDQWWCVDIGGKGGHADPAADCIAGIWLPSQEVVEVRLNDRE